MARADGMKLSHFFRQKAEQILGNQMESRYIKIF